METFIKRRQQQPLPASKPLSSKEAKPKPLPDNKDVYCITKGEIKKPSRKHRNLNEPAKVEERIQPRDEAHAGKQKQQRGTSAREDMLDCTINLSLPLDYKPIMGAFFNVKFEKHRNVAPGANLEPFSLRVVETQSGDGLTWTTEAGTSGFSNEQIIYMLLMDSDLPPSVIAERVSVSRAFISQMTKKAKDSGLMNRNRVATDKGKDFITWMKEEAGFEIDCFLNGDSKN
ncbi:hypothetical protein PITCH_A70001 [uncultured Desulfobacterium sp.]|uniref:Uncharacterized protein n=1 Tax=uncultured Desulfobacterium sp. TaxID=201089 RepID=A0A445N1P8_9BACT|nr:hypothetical protein PITCH_A70001 [uncultured Desulfobacterium sp.]